MIVLILSTLNFGYSPNENHNLEVTQTRYFLIGEAIPQHGDTFILPLSNESDILAALEILKQDLSERKRIVVAKIVKGGITGEYANKDLLDENKRIWSWRVSEFVGFADISAELYDGWPTYVESNLDEWIKNTNGKIGFWSYTVLREVPVSELR